MSISWSLLVIVGVLGNIFLLSVSSQWLFRTIDGFELTKLETYVFSFLSLNILINYIRCCLTNPGVVPTQRSTNREDLPGVERWCRKCQNVKPPRAHHCSQCQRCIPKMDHHCIWILNCVSYRVFPHFFRLLFYNVAGMAYLQFFLLIRFGMIFSNRHLPSHLGPSALQLVHLLLLSISNSITLFALFLMFCKLLYAMAFNVTTIEGWEIERHLALVKRARVNGGYVYGPNGIVLHIQKQEFPYDIGIWNNIVQSMGTSNVLTWFWSFGRSLPRDQGVWFDTNGFEDPSKSWPPPDPDKIAQSPRNAELSGAQQTATPDYSTESDVNSFWQRKAMDWAMRSANGVDARSRHPYSYSKSINEPVLEDSSSGSGGGPLANITKELWKNEEGERLRDFGVDEEEEIYDEDDLPLSQLIQNLQANAKS